MRKRILVLMTLVLGFWLLATQCAAAAPGTDTLRVAKVADLTGSVKVYRAGGEKSFAAFKGMGLARGDRIITGKGAWAILELENDKSLKIAQNSDLFISELIKNGEREEASFSLRSGAVYSNIKNKLSAGSKYEIRTPTAVMGVRGTQFVVQYREGQVQVDVLGGEVTVTISTTVENPDGTVTPQTTQLIVQSGEVFTRDESIPGPEGYKLEKLDLEKLNLFTLQVLHDLAVENIGGLGAQINIEELEQLLSQRQQEENARPPAPKPDLGKKQVNYDPQVNQSSSGGGGGSGGSPPSDHTVVEADKDSLAIGFAEGDNENSVTQNLTLLLVGTGGSNIGWSSDSTAVVSNTGVVNRGVIEQTVILTATISKGAASSNKVFTIVVKAVEEPGETMTLTSLRTAIAENLSATITLSNDLHVTQEEVNAIAEAADKGYYTGLLENSVVGFSGTFDGNNYKIILDENINVPDFGTSPQYGGFLFGKVTGTIKNLIIDLNGKTLTLNDELAGGLAYEGYGDGSGEGPDAQIINVQLTSSRAGGKITSAAASDYAGLGGLVYNNMNGSTISGCKISGVILEASWVGGFAKHNLNLSAITECGVENSSIIGIASAGGIVSDNKTSVGSLISGIVGCYVRDTAIEVEQGSAGGIAALNCHVISRCYVQGGNISSTSERGVGGITYNQDYGTVQDCYVLGTELSGKYAAGIAFTGGNPSKVENTYFNGTLSGSMVGGISNHYYNWAVYNSYYIDSIGGGGGTATSDSALGQIETYNNWDIALASDAANSNSIWVIDESGSINAGYPYLRNNLPGVVELNKSAPPEELKVFNYATGDDLIIGLRAPRDTLIKVYDAPSGGNLLASDTEVEGSFCVQVPDGFPRELSTVYISLTEPGKRESSRVAFSIPLPPELQMWIDFDIDESHSGCTIFTLSAEQKELIETAVGQGIVKIVAFVHSDREKCFSELPEAALGEELIWAYSEDLKEYYWQATVMRDPGCYGYAIAIYNSTGDVLAFFISDSYGLVVY